MNTKKKTLIGLVIAIIVIAAIFAGAFALKSHNAISQVQYQTGEGLTDNQKETNINDQVKKLDYDGAKILADNYYHYDNNLDKHREYIMAIEACKKFGLASLDECKATVNNQISAEINTSNKSYDEYNKIGEAVNSIGIDNLTKDQTISFINKYMNFWQLNKQSNSELHDNVVKNLIKLKQQYYKVTGFNRVIGNEMKLFKAEIGMTKAEVVAFTKYIQPKDINKTTTQYSVREQYCYSSKNYLYFEDGILTTIQE